MGLLTGAGYLIPKGGSSAWAQTCLPTDCKFGCSPPIKANFVDPLPIPPILPERDLTDPGFQPMPPQRCPFHKINPATGLPYEGRGQYNGILQEGTDCFQFFDQYPPQKYFIQRMRANPNFSITSDPNIPLQTIWGFNQGGLDNKTDPAIFPGPTIRSRYQQPIVVRRYNELPSGNGGFGVAETTTHLHNFHSGPESDGGPCRYFFQGQYYDYYYTMQQAGFASTHPPNGDLNESLSSLWYHDHRDMHTAENVYKGLAGFHLIFNEFDTGDEGTGFHLPTFPDFDIPLMLNDKLLNHTTGLICFSTFMNEGLVGDVYLVNGRVRPFLAVKKRRYRFRVLNAGPSRYYTLFLTNPDNLSDVIPFWVIGNDGNLLPQPIQVTSVRVSVAERPDIIIDFAQNAATRVRLENRLEQISGAGPTDNILPAGHNGGQGYLMEFQIGDVVPDNSVDPNTMPHFYNLPDNMGTPRITRTFVFNIGGPNDTPWIINGQVMDCSTIRFAVERNSIEHWILQNAGGGWHHPIHIHLEEHQILTRNGVPIPSTSVEHSRKDVVELFPIETVEIFMRFRDFSGDYPMHCHNTIHEDHAMMLLWQVADKGDNLMMP